MASSLGLASAGAMGIVGLSPLTEPPANDALAVRRLAFGAVVRMTAWPPVVSGQSDSDCVCANAHEDRGLTENPGDSQVAGM